MTIPADVLPQYGKWTVIEEVPPRQRPNRSTIRYLRVRCACDAENVVTLASLRRGRSRSCHACAVVKHHLVVGQVFGHLTVLENGIKAPGDRTRRTKVRCVCGTEKLIIPSRLVGGAVKSCGCLKYRRGQKSPLYKGAGEISGTFFRNIKDGARKRDIPFNVTIEYIRDLYTQQGGKCALTGLPLHLPRSRCKGTASLDRIRSGLPYQKGNLQWVHKAVNQMKGSLDQAVFVALCEAVAGYRGDDWLSPVLLKFMGEPIPTERRRT